MRPRLGLILIMNIMEMLELIEMESEPCESLPET